MASALQCPACGFKHRLSALDGDPIFSCAQCGRLLKTPVEYRRPEPSSPAEAPRPSTNANTSTVQRGGSATRDQTSVLQAPRRAGAGTAAAAGAAAGTAPRERRAPRPPTTLAVPLQILAWVVALVVGGVIVRYFARFTGLLTGDSVIDLITGTGWTRYLRLFAVVPLWAFATAGLMTLFVEGTKWWKARDAGPARRPATRRPARSSPPAPEAPAASTKMPRVVPPKPVKKARPPAPNPVAAETRSPQGAASAPRARRIPKRDLSSES